MQWSNVFSNVDSHARQLVASPRVTTAIAVMDTGIGFMTRRQYQSANPAINAVHGPLVAGLWVVLALAVVMLGWGIFAPIESAAVAQGKVVLLSNKKVIQHLEGGIIEALLVKEGDKVTAGQELVRLNSTAASSSRDTLESQLYAARAAEARLVAERDLLPSIVFDSDMIESSRSNKELLNTMAAQTRLFASGREALEAKRGILEQRIAQAQESIIGVKAQLDSTTARLATLDEEIATVESLLGKGYATKTRMFELQRHQSELQGAQGQYQAEISKTEEIIAETQMAMLDQLKEFETKNAQELRDIQVQIADLQDKLRTAKDVSDRTVITAPVAGVITGLKYHTSGGVIGPATPIMEIVPQDDQLIVEARMKPTDISTVHEGLDARVMFTAYKMRNTPKVPGKVTLVSADTFTDDRGVSYYTVRVEVDKDFLHTMEAPLDLTPGMPADILITTGSRSFFAYLFQPISDSMHSAFREQ